MLLAAGSRLGPYEIISALGVGGMGEVYRATDMTLGRQVAIKVLPDAFASDPDRLARFEREAKTLASLNNPHIAAIYGFEKSAGMHALVMELVEGPTLADRIAQGPISLDEALPIAKQIAEALESAHERGIIHRDLKPANIKVRADGTVKVLDFGLAKLAESGEAGPADRNLTQSPTITSPAMMTAAGVILGTAAYMSPEQARGKPIDTRTDVWAFGCVLFEMLTGQRAFDGESISDVLAAVLKSAPNLGAMSPGMPAALQRLVARCVEKDPRRRLQAIGEARVQIEDLLTGVPDPVAEPAASRRRLSPRLLFVGVTALLIGAAVAATGRRLAAPLAAPRLIRTNITATGSATLAINGISRDIAIAPDGSRVVYVGNNGTQLFVRTLDALEPVAIATGQIREPFMSPDGQWVGFVEGLGRLEKVAVSGGPSIYLATLDGAPQGATWLPDDTIVFGTNNSSTGLQRVSANGGTPTVVTRPDHTRGDVDHVWPEVLPGGRAILFTITAQTGGPDSASIAVLDLGAQTSTILVRGGSDAHYATSGHLLYVAAETLRAVRFDLRRLSVEGAALPVLARLLTTNRGAGDVGIASDGTLVYLDTTAANRSALARTLVWVDRTGKEEAIAAPTRAYQAARLSPDGLQIALAITDQESHIWVWDLRRSALRRLTFESVFDTFPVWMPDNRRLVFASQRESGALNLWWVAADGAGQAERLTTSANNQWSTSVTSDGKHVVIAESTLTMSHDLRLLTLDGARRVTSLLQTPFDEVDGTISPDGRWLAYASDVSGRFEIAVRPFPNTTAGQWQVSTAGGTRPVWAHSGKELFFFGADGALMRVPVEATARMWNAGAPVKVVDPRYYTGSPNPNRAYDVSADDRRFLMIKAASAEATMAAPSIIVVQHFDEELKRLVPTK